MTRILLTGGSGFVAAHILDRLLEQGHSVVATVRSEEKAQKIRDAHPSYRKDKLDFAIVQDIAQPDAFEKAVISDPPFEAVLHTASPFHYDNITDIKKDFLDPAVVGTTGILKSIHKSAPTVKRVVITSSFAAILNRDAPHGYQYSEKDWNPVTEEQAYESNSDGYRASKTFAERAAWDFVDKEKPKFTLTTMNPPLVMGPVANWLNTLDNTNTSNQRIRDMMTGVSKNGLTPTGVFFWVDVRDLAIAHVKAAELEAAANKRFFVTAGYFSNRDIADIIRENFPDLKDKVASTEEALKPGDYPPKEELVKYDNSRVIEVLGMKFTSLKDCIIDTVKSMQNVQGK